jgi:SAM-dependent methyltransferase
LVESIKLLAGGRLIPVCNTLDLNILMNSPDYYDIPEHWDHRSLNRVQTEVLWLLDRECEAFPADSRALDAGAGDGLLINEFIRRHSDLEGVAVDWSKEALIHVLPPTKAILADLIRLPFPDGHFSLTWCVDVFEHLPPAKSSLALAEMIRVTDGSLLLVTPYLESDAVITKCPHCRTIFSPYHHVNVMSMKRWETLLLPWQDTHELSFVPLGDTKPYLPFGLGRLMASAGAFCTHGKTVCPMCHNEFCRNESLPINVRNDAIAEFVASHRQSAGVIPEEMGVLISARRERRESVPAHTIWVDVPNDRDWAASLECNSPLAIDFSDEASGRTAQTLLEFPAYWLISSPLNPAEAIDGRPVRAWEIAGEEPGVQHAVFPPPCIDDARSIVLDLAARNSVEISIAAFNRVKGSYDLLHDCIVEASAALNRLTFPLNLGTEHVTPFGVIVRLTAWPVAGDRTTVFLAGCGPEDAGRETFELRPGLNSLGSVDFQDAVFRLLGSRPQVRQFILGGQRRIDFAAIINSKVAEPVLLPRLSFFLPDAEPVPAAESLGPDWSMAILYAKVADLDQARAEIANLKNHLSVSQQQTNEVAEKLHETSLRAVAAESDLARINASRSYRILNRLRSYVQYIVKTN